MVKHYLTEAQALTFGEFMEDYSIVGVDQTQILREVVTRLKVARDTVFVAPSDLDYQERQNGERFYINLYYILLGEITQVTLHLVKTMDEVVIMYMGTTQPPSKIFTNVGEEFFREEERLILLCEHLGLKEYKEYYEVCTVDLGNCAVVMPQGSNIYEVIKTVNRLDILPKVIGNTDTKEVRTITEEYYFENYT